MIGSRLQDYREDDPTWGFIAQLGAEQFTGEVRLGSDPQVRLYVDEGAIYFAEREGDSPLQSRLVVRGALSPAQLARGGVFADGTVSLARLFTRDTSIDRHEVEVAIERSTQEVLDEVGPQPVGSVQLTPLRHHDSGVHEWARRIQPPRPTAFDSLSVASVAPRPAPPVPAPISLFPLAEEPPAAPASAPLATPSLAVPPLAAPLVAPPLASPFSAPPAAETAADLPAPTLAAPLEAAPVPDAQPVLPTLSSRVMSVAEITAAQPVSSAAGEDQGDRFTPADLSGLDLPKLATKVMSVAEITAHEAADDATMDSAALALAEFEPAIDDDTLPQLATPRVEPVPQADAAPEQPSDDGEAATDDLPEDAPQVAAPHHPAHDIEPISPWATPAQNLAAVEIWEMVDEMLAAESSPPELVSAGAPSGARSGRWRRGKKG